MENKIGIGFMRHDPSNFLNTQKIVDSAMQSGVNYFESCYFYLGGQCEHIVQESLNKYPRESYQLCAKMPVKGILENIKNPDKIFQEQLNNLHTDYFDVYLLQALDASCLNILQETKVIPYLLQKKKEGKIKQLGFSFHGTPYHLEKLLSLACWDVIQLQLNYYDYFLSSGKENYKLAEKYNIPIIVMGPTKGGTLINNLPAAARSLLGEEWKFYPYKFLFSLPKVKMILTGAENEFQLNENINYIQNKLAPLTEKEWQLLEQVINIYRKNNYIQCTGCNYCQPCPSGINISYYFKEYNNILKEGTNYYNFNNYMEFCRDNMPNFICLNCGRCEKMCPQHLNIRQLFSSLIFQMRL